MITIWNFIKCSWIWIILAEHDKLSHFDYLGSLEKHYKRIFLFVFLNYIICFFRVSLNQKNDPTEATVLGWKDTFATYGIGGIYYRMFYWFWHCSSVIFTSMRRLLSPDACLLFLCLWCIRNSWEFSSCSEK